MSVALAVVAALHAFGTADFVMSDGQRYVARGDYQAASLRVLDTEPMRWRTFEKPAGCGPNWAQGYRPMRSGRLLLVCEADGHLSTLVMFLRTGTTRRLHGADGVYVNLGASWAQADRTYVNLGSGHRVHVRDSQARDLD